MGPSQPEKSRAVGNGPRPSGLVRSITGRARLLDWFADDFEPERGTGRFDSPSGRRLLVLESEDADTYYRWIKPRGGMDFVEDIVRPGSERGVHLDVARHFPGTIVTDRIAPENVHRLIAAIRSAA